jgi:hypothetical protein
VSEEETENPPPAPPPPDPEAPDPESDAEVIPESVPDNWLDPKPFDPAGR